MVIEVSCNC